MSDINLVTLLQKILSDTQGGSPGCVNISPQEREWIEQFLSAPDTRLQFSFKAISEDDEITMAETNFFISGHKTDVFMMLDTAAKDMPMFGHILEAAANKFNDEVPRCPRCFFRHVRASNCPDPDSWNFTPQPINNDR
jgi:hypothetical protein